MNETMVVPGVVEGDGDRFADQQAVGFPDMLFALQELGERIAVDILHDVVPVAVAVVEVVGLHDARMVDFLHQALFGAELPDFCAVGGEFLVEDLHGDNALVDDVPGFPDG